MMSMRAPLVALLLAVWAGAHAAQPAALPEPMNLHADGIQSAQHRKPVVILFSLPGCAYCEVVRKNYLVPLLKESAALRPIIREVDISANKRFADFRQKQVSHRELADRYGVRVAPTVIFIDSAGNLLTEPIIGGDTAGLYGGYLDNAFAEATRKLDASRNVETKGDKK
jgi:thioredoxin-related protein